jgi:DNA repair photolyase
MSFAGKITEMKLIAIDKKSQILTPSSLPCLAKIPTINISAGCSHNCVYCYSKGYSNYPGNNTVTIYSNLAEKLSSELVRKRKLPYAVYFCPSCDPFQPVKEILACSFALMELLLKRNIGVQFVTKGFIPDQFMDLFSKYPSLVSGQIGISCTNENIRKILEPVAASISDRLKTLKVLTSLKIDVAVRADPLIYSITDSDSYIKGLCKKISENGAKQLAVSYLFLRPVIKNSLESNIFDKDLLKKILEPYKAGNRVKIGTSNSFGLALPAELRKQSYERIKAIAQKFEIAVHICGCKNKDIISESCHISKPHNKTYATLF